MGIQGESENGSDDEVVAAAVFVQTAHARSGTRGRRGGRVKCPFFPAHTMDVATIV